MHGVFGASEELDMGGGEVTGGTYIWLMILTIICRFLISDVMHLRQDLRNAGIHVTTGLDKDK